MGISGGKTVKTTSNETATTTPSVPSFYQEPANSYYGKVNNFLNTNPNDFITPANSLQTQAFGNASNLGGQNFDAALMQLLNARTSLSNINPTQASYASNPTPYKATNVAGLNGPNVSQAGMGTLNPVTQAGSQGYNAPQVGQAQNYNASQVGDASRFLDGSVERVQGQSLLDNLSAYQNPATESLVAATLAETDDYNGRQLAAQRARMAGSGAFGGSRSALSESQLLADQGRNRSLTDAELRYNAFNTATGLSADDANRRQQAGVFNAGAQNQRDELLGQLGFQGDIFNTGARNDAAAFGANAANDFRLAQAGYDANAAQFGANAANTANLANAGAANQYGLAAFDAANQNNQFNAGSANAANNLLFSNEAQNARQNAQSANDIASQIYGTTADNNRFNASQSSNTDQFNANLALQRAQQEMAGAGQYADILNAQGASNRADASLQGQLGQQQWDLQNQQTQAPLIQLLAAQGLLDPSMAGLFTGQTINSTGSGTQKESGGLLQMILAASAQAGSAAAAASERRVKRDIQLLGREDDGLGCYAYNYVWDASGEPVRYGVMVDEVAALRPWALGPVMQGIQTVDYSKLEAR